MTLALFQYMKDVIAITSTVYALGTFLWACSLKYRQSRTASNVASVPMLPFVFAIALFITFAVWGFDLGLPYWVYPVIFIITLFFPGYLLIKAPGHGFDTSRVEQAHSRPTKRGANAHLKLVIARTRER